MKIPLMMRMMTMMMIMTITKKHNDLETMITLKAMTLKREVVHIIIPSLRHKQPSTHRLHKHGAPTFCAILLQ